MYVLMGQARDLRKEDMATELGPHTEREMRARRQRDPDPTNTTPHQKKQRAGSRLVVETDDGG
jgi:hypothetical protein